MRKNTPNNALHLTVVLLRFITTSDLGHYTG